MMGSGGMMGMGGNTMTVLSVLWMLLATAVVIALIILTYPYPRGKRDAVTGVILAGHMRAHPSGLARVVLLVFLGGCATVDISKIQISVSPRPDLLGFSRVLVAGFVADGSDQIALNEETALFLRTQLRSQTSLRVIESEPVVLAAAPTDSPAVRAEDVVFTNVPFWKSMGEEYSQPLIVTGTIVFKPAAPRFEERTVGRRTMHLWRRGFSLSLRLILINGETGEIIDSLVLRQLTAHATTGREGALSLYFRLMDQTTSSILRALGRQTSQGRVLFK